MSELYVTVGEIVNTQGIKGEVRILPTTDFPERFKRGKKYLVLLRGSHREYTIEKSWEHKQFIVIKFAEIENMNEAEKLKGGLLQVSPSELTPLPKGSHYIFQLVGLRVLDLQGQELGELAQVIKTGANDVYVVKRNAGKDVLIPALKSVVKEINIPEGKMLVDLPEGLI
ncbi:hypothetical protein N752_23490 [Desulforamulus aquiferis]|nr:ribosome maturation factor RimM [Desulforamulus aquiferis]RYD02747.1 hypothetical protein N752_23490 [Desulforamulus aquiferis]